MGPWFRSWTQVGCRASGFVQRNPGLLYQSNDQPLVHRAGRAKSLNSMARSLVRATLTSSPCDLRGLRGKRSKIRVRKQRSCRANVEGSANCWLSTRAHLRPRSDCRRLWPINGRAPLRPTSQTEKAKETWGAPRSEQKTEAGNVGPAERRVMRAVLAACLDRLNLTP